MTKVYDKIVENGPITSIDGNGLNTITNREREVINKFRPNNSTSGSTLAAGASTPVFYHRRLHTPEEVVRTWVEENQDYVEKAGKWSVHQQIASYGQEFKAASYSLLAPFDVNQGTGGAPERDCPLCGDRINILPDHLPDCPEK